MGSLLSIIASLDRTCFSSFSLSHFPRQRAKGGKNSSTEKLIQERLKAMRSKSTSAFVSTVLLLSSIIHCMNIMMYADGFSKTIYSRTRSNFIATELNPNQARNKGRRTLVSPLFSEQPQSSNSVSNNDDINNFTKATGGSSEKSQISFRERLLKLSNIASLLCVVDCTVLPIITVVLPFLGLGTSTATAKRLHELGHSIAIYFVLPVGGLASIMNYLNHNKKSLLALSLIGLACVYAANGHGGPILSRLPHSLAHSLHCGTSLHRVTNIMGCAFLLSSNHLGRKISGCGSKDCGMDHGHAVDAECGSHRRHD